jgi:hypothetical protein
MSVAIRSPSGSYRGDPHGTVVSFDSPRAVFVEFIGAYDIGRDILIRLRMILAIVADTAPVVETVEVGCTGSLMLERSPSREGCLMAGT